MTILVEMREARRRALTHACVGLRAGLWHVEMREARRRALTHSWSALLNSVNNVEMREARRRALTQPILSLNCYRNHRRNERSPMKGIDTHKS